MPKKNFFSRAFLKANWKGQWTLNGWKEPAEERDRVTVGDELQQVQDRQRSLGFIVSLSCTLFLINKKTCFISKMNELSPIWISPLKVKKWQFWKLNEKYARITFFLKKNFLSKGNAIFIDIMKRDKISMYKIQRTWEKRGSTGVPEHLN